MKVTVYSVETCPHCQDLKKWLDEHKVKYKNIDVSKNQEAADEMVEKSGQMHVPVIEVDKDIVVGFEAEKLKKLLGIKD